MFWAHSKYDMNRESKKSKLINCFLRRIASSPLVLKLERFIFEKMKLQVTLGKMRICDLEKWESGGRGAHRKVHDSEHIQFPEEGKNEEEDIENATAEAHSSTQDESVEKQSEIHHDER